jgi:hypothetical protein
MRSPVRPPHTPTTYQVGDRIRLSELGKSRSRTAVTDLGVVTAVPKGSTSVWICLDGNKTSVPIHRSYIEPA